MQHQISISSEKILEQLKKNKTQIENPANISGVGIFNCEKIGAFTFFRGGNISRLKEIGRFCSLAPNVNIGPEEHDINLLTTSTFLNSWNHVDISKHYWTQPENKPNRDKILNKIRSQDSKNQQNNIIGNDVWIGQNVIIRRGVKIGDGAVIGAGAVVSKNVDNYEVIGGVPAKHIKYRFSKEIRDILNTVNWWHWSLDSLKGLPWDNVEKCSKILEIRYKNKEFDLADYEVIRF